MLQEARSLKFVFLFVTRGLGSRFCPEKTEVVTPACYFLLDILVQPLEAISLHSLGAITVASPALVLLSPSLPDWYQPLVCFPPLSPPPSSRYLLSWPLFFPLPFSFTLTSPPSLPPSRPHCTPGYYQQGQEARPPAPAPPPPAGPDFPTCWTSSCTRNSGWDPARSSPHDVSPTRAGTSLAGFST